MLMMRMIVICRGEDGMKILRSHRAGVVLTAGLLLSVAACGGGSSSSSSSASGGNLPDTIKVVGIEPETGPAAFAGLAAEKGYKLAVKEINDQHYLGSGVKIDLSFQDTTGQAATAASALSQTIADKNVAAVFGSVSSQEAVAQSPLAQNAGMPIIYTQAGSEGVVIGDFTYRATPLMASYYPIIKKYVQENGWKSVGVIYTNASPTLQEVGTKVIPDLGMKVTASVATTATTQDFTSAIQQVLASKPDVVSILQVGAANPTAMTQLRQAGYTGPVLGNSGASAGNLKPAGDAGKDMVWPVDFNFQQQDSNSQKFVDAYKAEYNENPLNYAAEAYDAAWFLAHSIKEAGSADRTKIKDGMAAVAKKPMDGALGSNLTWKDQTIQVAGSVIQWTGTDEKLLYSASS
jgi:branched-chain amino acid transport system substrate-binding protein